MSDNYRRACNPQYIDEFTVNVDGYVAGVSIDLGGNERKDPKEDLFGIQATVTYNELELRKEWDIVLIEYEETVRLAVVPANENPDPHGNGDIVWSRRISRLEEAKEPEWNL